jgi:hypothetical protein
MVGSWFAKAIVQRMDARHYASILEVMMVFAGLTMIYAAFS